MQTYLRHKICNVIDIKDLIALEYLDFEGKYRDYVEAHDFWELCYVTEGRVRVLLDGSSLPLIRQQLVLIPPNKKHGFLSDNGNGSKAFVVCFDSFSQALLPISSCVFERDEVQTRCMEIIISECATTFCMNGLGLLEVVPTPLFGGQQALLSQLEYLLIHLIRRMSEKKDPGIVFISDDHFHADLVNVILRFLRKNIHQKLTLEDLCGTFNYSKSFLCKTFKEQTGQTLIDYYNGLKIEEAKRLLTQSSRSVTDIAGSLGFREVKYFDAIFKKSTGMTPVTYRNKENHHEN